jgi:signal transduction histidine kinase
MKLGTKLILCLVATLTLTMMGHGYLSIQQDQENILREMRVGMIGLSRSIQAALRYMYGDARDLQATQKFIDGVARAGNIHGIVVYDRDGKAIVTSVSLTDASDSNLDPAPVLKIDPGPVLTDGQGLEGYLEHAAHPVYYRIEPVFSSDDTLSGAFVLGRRGIGYNLTLQTRRNRIILTTCVLFVILTSFILFLVRRNVSRPIEQLIERIRNIGSGHWEQRIEIQSRNEIGALAAEFNQMCARLEDLYGRLLKEQRERLELERNLRQSDKLASVGQLAAGLAHEIGTPLNIIGGRAEFLLRRPRSAQELRDNIQIIRSQIDRITGIVRQLLEFARRREPAVRKVELATVLERVIDLLKHKIADKKVCVERTIAADLPPVQADPAQLEQVFVNLFLNSLHALEPGGTIGISARLAESRASTGRIEIPPVQIRFEDNGRGIAAEYLRQVFDPFFTTKDVGEGTGLGLSVSYGIIKDHGGEIHVESLPGRYTCFTISLPAYAQDGVSEPRSLAS